MSIAAEMAQWLTSLRREDIPNRVMEMAKYQLLNVLASIHAGYHTREGQSVLESVADSNGNVTALPTGMPMHHLDALFVDSTLSMTLDYDDYLFLGHTGHSAVGVALTLGELLGKPAEDILIAQLIANEVEGRMGAAVVLGPRNGQMWSYIHHLGAACAAARLLGLDAYRTEQAIAISLYQPNLTLFPGFMGGQSKVTTAAVPALSGVRAAFLAQAGMKGASGIIEGPQGFLEEFAYAPSPFWFTGWGRAWLTESLAFKPYPGCAYIDTTIDSLLAIMAEYRERKGVALDPEQVASIDVRASILTMEMNEQALKNPGDDPLAPVNINFSIPKSAALALLDGNLTGASFAAERFERDADRILALAAKVHLEHDWLLSADVVRGTDACVDYAAAFDQYTMRELVAILKGLRTQAGSLSRKGIGAAGERIPSRVKEGMKQVMKSKLRHPLAKQTGNYTYDLGEHDFSIFRMPFAADVTLTTHDGETYHALRDIPRGAPGSEDIPGTVREKFEREASRALPDRQVAETIRIVQDFEERGLDKLLRAVCIL